MTSFSQSFNYSLESYLVPTSWHVFPVPTRLYICTYVAPIPSPLGHPRAKDYATDEQEEVGQVVVVRRRKMRQIIKGSQFAAYFGAAVAFADVNADG